MSLKNASLLIITILLIDQVSKVYIKTNFRLQESVEVFSWFQVLFVENDGMAWGAKLSDFFSFILGGELGNIIDSVFYGVMFDDSLGQVATFLPDEGGYDTLLHGKVVDMLHFPLWKGYLPEWIPFIGGQYFTFFEPVFNIADMAISTGVGLLLFFNKRAFTKTEEEEIIPEEEIQNV